MSKHWIEKISSNIRKGTNLNQWQNMKAVPLDETHLAVVRELIHQEVPPKCVNEESSTERRSYNRQVNRSPQL